MPNVKHTYTDQELLQQFANGSISKQDLYGLERKSLDDPFLAEAMEGFKDSGMHGTRKLPELPNNRTKVFSIRGLVGLAASFIILLGVGYVLVLNQDKELSPDAATTEKSSLDDVVVAKRGDDEILPEPETFEEIENENDLALQEINAYQDIIENAPIAPIQPEISKKKSQPSLAKPEPESAKAFGSRAAKTDMDAGLSVSPDANHSQGKEFFENYIDKEKWSQMTPNEKPSQGKVVLSFLVDQYGDPIQISIISTPSEKSALEAQRLLLNGGKWQPSQNIRVQYTFNL